ncbi:MAG: hypothetical protein AB8B93_13830 [Pseudomonadales bacterium]
MIGTLNESPLHEALKFHYLEHHADPGAQLEVPVNGFVADVLCGQQIFEIQTAGLGTMRRKLNLLLPDYQIVVVLPVAVRSVIIKLSQDNDGTFTRRRSPKRGTLLSVLDELVSVPELLNHPNFTLEVALIEQELIRTYSDSARRGRGGWRTVERRLLSVLDTHRFGCAGDLWTLLDNDLSEPFGTAELALALGSKRSVAQKYAYCLRGAEQIAQVGKQGNALLYSRVPIQETV